MQESYVHKVHKNSTYIIINSKDVNIKSKQLVTKGARNVRYSTRRR